MKKLSLILALFPPNPQANQKERSHEALEIFKVLARKENRKHSATRVKKSIPPIPSPRKQSAGFPYQYATKFLYGIFVRFVQDLAKRTSQYPQNPQKVFEE